MCFIDTPFGKILLAMSVMLLIFPVYVQFNYVNYKEFRIIDYTAQVKISIL